MPIPGSSEVLASGVARAHGHPLRDYGGDGAIPVPGLMKNLEQCNAAVGVLATQCNEHSSLLVRALRTIFLPTGGAGKPQR